MLRRTSSLQSRLFQDGADFEAEKFGKCGARCTEYRKWREAAEEAKRCQPQRKTEFVQQLERMLAQVLDAQVACFTAVGSAFDIFHGVDAFIEYRGVIVTVDATLNPDKVVGKADLVFYKHHDAADLAGRMARAFREKATKQTYRRQGTRPIHAWRATA